MIDILYFMNVLRVDMEEHVPLNVETISTRCHVTTSMDFVTVVVHLVGLVIKVTNGSVIPLKCFNILYYEKN